MKLTKDTKISMSVDQLLTLLSSEWQDGNQNYPGWSCCAAFLDEHRGVENFSKENQKIFVNHLHKIGVTIEEEGTE